jgi:hypothetical protein
MDRPDELQLLENLRYLLETQGIVTIPAGTPDAVLDELLGG